MPTTDEIFVYRALHGANGLLNAGDVVEIAGEDGIRFLVMPDSLNRKQQKQWDKRLRDAETNQALVVNVEED